MWVLLRMCRATASTLRSATSVSTYEYDSGFTARRAWRIIKVTTSVLNIKRLDCVMNLFREHSEQLCEWQNLDGTVSYLI